MMLSRISAPSAALVAVDEAKAHCRIDGDDDDAVILALASAAADYLDGPSGILGRAILGQTWRLELPSWPPFIELPVEPVISAEVRYLDVAGVEQVLDASAYRLVAPLGAAPTLQWGLAKSCLGSGMLASRS
ncbi:head-tail connector protein [Gemmobacter lanyuensis]